MSSLPQPGSELLLAQLDEVAAALYSHGARCWLDSGTLLGLWRDGDLLKGDQDLDLGCWEGDAAALEASAAAFRRSGYRVLLRRYRGRPYKLKLSPPLREQRRRRRIRVDVTVYWRHGDHAWAPAFYFTLSRLMPWTARWFLDQGARSAVKVLWLRFAAPAAWRLPFPRMRLAMGTWKLPARHFETLGSLEAGGASFPVPADTESYLEYRYGDWRRAVRDWDWFRDDRGVVHEVPERAIIGWQVDGGARP